MARTTKSNKYEGIKRNNPIIVMKTGGATKKSVADMDYSKRSEYINKKYIQHLKSADMSFMIYSNGFSYDYKDRATSKEQLLKYYSEQADYTEENLNKDTNYKVNDWELVRKEYDPETNEVIDEHELQQEDSGNTYNGSYLGLIDLNWRLYHDSDYDKWFYVIHPHVGGDIRGNYGDAFILEGDDKEELFYRFYEGFVSGMAFISLEFNDGSRLTFDSEQDSDVFYFRHEGDNSDYNPKSIGAKFLKDFETFSDWRGDEFLEETVDKFIAEKGQIEKKSGGGAIGSSDAPRAYVQILGYGEGQWMDVERGDDFLQSITDWMNELNEEKGGNREEWEISDWDGFGQRYYERYMSESDFDEVMDAYEAFENSDYSIEVIEGYMSDTGVSDMSEAISDMNEKYLGAYSSLSDMAYQMVEEGIYTPSVHDMFVTDTDKRLISNEEADSIESDMDFDTALEYADMTDDYDVKKNVIEDEISELQNKLTDLEDYLKDAEGDDYDVTTESISDVEAEIEDLESDLSRLEDEMDKEVRENVRELIYDETYNQLDRDLQGFLDKFGYENYSEVGFVTIDYDAIGEELSADYTVIDDGGKKYVFTNYKGGGKVVMLGKPNAKYTHYVLEMNSKKIISGWENKSDANDSKKELTGNNKKARFSVYSKEVVKNKYGLDTETYRDWIDLKDLSNAGKVAVRKGGNFPKNAENSDSHTKIIKQINQLKAKSKKATANEKKNIQEEISLLKKKATRLKAKNYIDTGTFSFGGALERVKVGAGHVKRGAIRGGSWLNKQWNEADFGDGTGGAKFDVGGDIADMFDVVEYGEGGAVKSKRIITEKIGFNETATDYLVGLSEKFSIWMADAILKKEMKDGYGGTYEDLDNTFGGGFIKVDNDKVAKKGVIEWQKNQPNWIRKRYGHDARLILDWLQHPITPSQNLRELTFDDAVAKAKEWHDELQMLGGDIDFVEPKENEILKKYPKTKDGIEYYWVTIPSNFCNIESSRMGHCGRTGYGNTLISLRSIKPYGKDHTVSDSHVTIAIGGDYKFYQAKGKKNQKPSEKYFEYIFDLIKLLASEGNFKGFSSEYQSEDDYGFSDMTASEVKELYEKYPDIFKGFAGEYYLYNAGVVSEKPSTSFTIKKDCNSISDLLEMSRDLRDDIITTILCGDTHDLIQGNWDYYFQNYSDMINMLDEENEKRIIGEIATITSYSIADVKEKGIQFYLDNEDEEFDSDHFENIVRSMANAMSSAEESEYHNYYYKQIKDCLEELGTVEYLDDSGVVIYADLSNMLSYEDISRYMEDLNTSDLEDVFFEALSNDGDIQKPQLSIDDRWTPYVSNKDFNDILSEGDLQEGYAKGGKVKKYAKGSIVNGGEKLEGQDIKTPFGYDFYDNIKHFTVSGIGEFDEENSDSEEGENFLVEIYPSEYDELDKQNVWSSENIKEELERIVFSDDISELSDYSELNDLKYEVVMDDDSFFDLDDLEIIETDEYAKGGGVEVIKTYRVTKENSNDDVVYTKDYDNLNDALADSFIPHKEGGMAFVRGYDKNDKFVNVLDRRSHWEHKKGIKFAKGGAIYKVQKIGEEDKPLSESMMSAKNLSELKRKVKEKYGTIKGFRVTKRSKSGAFYHVVFDDGGVASGSLKRGEIENKIEGLKLQIAKTKKQISGYETTQRGKYNQLFKEKVLPLQEKLDVLSDLWGKAKYANGGGVDEETYMISFLDRSKNFQQTDKLFKGKDAYEKAVKWGKENLSNFNYDMVRYVHRNGGVLKDDLGLSKKQQEKIFQLPYESAVYVPSTQDVDKVVSIDEMNKRGTDVKKFLSKMFGGYTSSETVGGFIDSKGQLVNEEIVKVTSFSTKEAFESNKQELLKQISAWAKEWGQEAIGFEFEGQLYYVPENFKNGGLTPLQKGTKVEMEHKKTLGKLKTGKYSENQGAKMIAKDHLKERKDYYDVVARVGLKNGGGVDGYEDLYSSSVKGLMKLQKMSDEELLNEANTISYYERMDDDEPEITDVAEAKKYLIDYYSDLDDDSIEPFKRGGELWIQDAVDRMKKKGTVGAFTKQAKTHKMNPVRFAKVVLNNPKKYTQKTRRRAQFVKNTNPEKF